MEKIPDPPEDVKINLNETEHRLLQALTDGKRQTPKNLSVIVGDVTSNYTANLLRELEKKGYTKSPGPADRSGMYTITDLGRIAVDHLEAYTRDFREEFDACCRFVLANQPPDTETVKTDVMFLDEQDYAVLNKASEVDGLVTGDYVSDETITTKQANKILYRLYFFGLLDQQDGLPVYEITERGEKNLSRGEQAIVGEVIETAVFKR